MRLCPVNACFVKVQGFALSFMLRSLLSTIPFHGLWGLVLGFPDPTN